jgi:hypothetical protein
MELASGHSGEFRNDDEFLEFEPECDDLFTERGQVVLVAVSRFFD